MTSPRISIPSLDTLANYDIGAWVWSQPSPTNKLAGADSQRLLYVNQYLNHNVWIHRLGAKWFAGVEKDGICLLAGVWNAGSTNPNKLGELVGVTGRYSKSISQVAEVHQTKRLWGFLEAQANSMVLRTQWDRKTFEEAATGLAKEEGGNPLFGADLLKMWSANLAQQ